MKIVKISMELVIDEDLIDLDGITDYLNKMLYTDPEFFGGFCPENIINIKQVD